MIRRVVPILVLATAVLTAVSAAAQPATPSPTPSSDKTTFFMFVQAADRATITETGQAKHYRMVLHGVDADAIYFSDRPQRIAGKVENSKFLKGLNFDKNNPPNAAIVGTAAGKMEHIVVAELTAPKYDKAKKTLTYDVALLSDYEGEALAHWSGKARQALPASLTDVSLFIDDCPDFPPHCYGDFQSNGDQVCRVDCGTLSQKHGQCWNWVELKCQPCHDWSDECNAQVCGPGRGLPPFCNVKCGSSSLCTPNR